MSLDAAELRRQRILQNQEKRLALVLGNSLVVAYVQLEPVFANMDYILRY